MSLQTYVLLYHLVQFFLLLSVIWPQQEFFCAFLDFPIEKGYNKIKRLNTYLINKSWGGSQNENEAL